MFDVFFPDVRHTLVAHMFLREGFLNIHRLEKRYLVVNVCRNARNDLLLLNVKEICLLSDVMTFRHNTKRKLILYII